MAVTDVRAAAAAPNRPAPTADPRGRRARIAARLPLALLMAVLGVVALATGMWLSGCRWYVVETPSMAETAPVGSLIVTAPTRHLQVGDVIAFRPPGLDRVYTHRIVEMLPDGSVHTQGDLNGAQDAWTTPTVRIVGRAVAMMPGIGFLARALPLLIGGALLIWWVSMPIVRPDRRAAVRIMGLHLLVSMVLLLLHPLASISLLATGSDEHGLNASVVSTGLLPVVLTSPTGDHLAALHDGQLATVPLQANAAGRLAVGAMLDLTLLQHLLLIALTLLPAAAVLLIGLPRAPEDAPADADGTPLALVGGAA